MERPERYDPEDLEHLMLERSFDELLAEERAYALRHLAGRAEYERMRALLQHVHAEKNERPPMDAAPAVREQVLQAFRAQQKPQWTIWLNSVKAFLIPEHPADLWRPALVFGSLFAIVFTAVVTWRALDQPGMNMVAEVQQEKTVVPPVVTGEATVAVTLKKEEQVGPKTDGTASGQQLPNPRPGALQEAAEVAPSPAQQETLAPVATVALPDHQPDEKGYATMDEADIERSSATSRMETTASSKLARTEEVELDKANAVAPLKEDDLLGLLRAAW